MILASVIPEISLGAPKFKVGHVTLNTALLRVICQWYAGTWHSLPVYKIWPIAFAIREIMVAAHQNLNGAPDPTTPFSWARNCHDQHIYQIWILYLHPLRRNERRYKMLKVVWFSVVRAQVTQGHGNSAVWYSTYEFLLGFHSN